MIYYFKCWNNQILYKATLPQNKLLSYLSKSNIILSGAALLFAEILFLEKREIRLWSFQLKCLSVHTSSGSLMAYKQYHVTFKGMAAYNHPSRTTGFDFRGCQVRNAEMDYLLQSCFPLDISKTTKTDMKKDDSSIKRQQYINNGGNDRCSHRTYLIGSDTLWEKTQIM